MAENKKIKEAWELATKTMEDHPAWDHFELTWRIGRALFLHGMDFYPEGTTQHKKLMLQSVKLMKKAEKDAKGELATSFHFNYIIGCAVGKASDYLKTKARIAKAFTIRDYFAKSIALDPEQPKPYHMMGQWCFKVASISAVERFLAKILFVTPPTSTFEEALKYFKKSHAMSDPSDATYILNMVKIGNTYKALKKYAVAREWYRKAMDTDS
eukprot:526884_1